MTMLGRTANQLYWMARYIERAENIARLIDVANRMVLLDVPGQAHESVWGSTLEVAGYPEDFVTFGGKISSSGVVLFLAFDDGFPSSIFSSIRAARENARALRVSITSEMWESINATWLELRDYDSKTLFNGGVRDFCDWVKERTHSFRGVTDATMLRDESYAFLDLGLAVERADNTARLLDSKYHVLLPHDEHVGGSVDYYQWATVLRSLSAFRAYHKIYSDVIQPRRVAELLLLRGDMPRSLMACFERITSQLDSLCHGRPQECQRIAGEIHAGLRFGRIDDIIGQGLHEFLTRFIGRNADLGLRIEHDFMMLQRSRIPA